MIMGDESKNPGSLKEAYLAELMGDIQLVMDQLEGIKKHLIPSVDRLESVANAIQRAGSDGSVVPSIAALENRAQNDLRNFVAQAVTTLKQEGFVIKRDTLTGFDDAIRKVLKESGKAAFVGAANEFERELRTAVDATKLDLVAVSEKAKNSLDSVGEQNWNLRVQLFAGGCGLAGLIAGLILAHWMR